MIPPFTQMGAAVVALAVLAAAEVRGDPASPQPASMIIAVGAAGEETFGAEFLRWTQAWEKAASGAGIAPQVIGRSPEEPSRQRLREALEREAREGSQPLWVVLLGHGTWQRDQGKLNLTGDDLSTQDLKSWLEPVQRPTIVVAGFAGSGGWLRALARPDRIIISATKSGSEDGFTRFPGFLSETIADTAADLDRDGQTSLLEAWLAAGQRTAAFYESQGRLATEHTLLDDTGDGLGTPHTFFRGVRAIKKPAGKAALDGLRAHQVHLLPSMADASLAPEIRAQRDTLEREIAALREAKAAMPEAEYYTRLESLLLQLAKALKTVP